MGPHQDRDKGKEVNNLLPCPFCGNIEIHIESDSEGSSISCYKCGIGTVESNWTEKAAIDIWNTRQTPPHDNDGQTA
jgi:Lar family restriction alleviation protein